MNNPEYLPQLVTLLRGQRDSLLARWMRDARLLPGAKTLPRLALEDHIPAFLTELIDALAVPDSTPLVEAHSQGAPRAHGLQRLADGFDIDEVVAEYNILRDVIQDVVEEHGITLHGRAARIVNRVLDRAVSIAVENYAKQRAIELQQHREEHLAFIVHDLRTPLNALSLVVQELEATLPMTEGEDGTEMVDMLKRNISRLNILVAQVTQEQVNLIAARNRKLERRDLDLAPLVRLLLREMQPLAEEAETNVAEKIPINLIVYADVLQLTQILQNLIGNALRFSRGGIVIIGAQALASGIECWVQDNGSGIPSERLEHIFDKLETDPDPTKKSTGLGLAIVKQAVEAHGGVVSVESEPGQGTIFRFILPNRSSQ